MKTEDNIIVNEMDQIINNLNDNPIFRMSLGSKELFHSNFLEYLWYVKQEAFIDMINDILPILEANVRYKIGREKENFDICIYHVDNNKDVYDLVLENKVKSIPYKEQLSYYVKKASEKSCNCRFILLTLSEDFPDKDDKTIQDEWKIVKYDQLQKKIEEHFLKKNICSEKESFYIRDYCNFIKQLSCLKNIMLPSIILDQPLFNNNDIDKLKEIRLHDLYIKLRCSWFTLMMKNTLKCKGVDTQIVHKFQDVKQGIVNLNIDMNQGNGQIAAWICDQKNNVFEIVIQGNQYRHGINQRSIKTTKNDKYNRLNELYSRLSSLPDKRPFEFLNFKDNSCVKPSSIKKFQKTETLKSGPFDCYDKDYIYRYILIQDNSKKVTQTYLHVKDLINQMINDIIGIYTNIPKL